MAPMDAGPLLPPHHHPIQIGTVPPVDGKWELISDPQEWEPAAGRTHGPTPHDDWGRNQQCGNDDGRPGPLRMTMGEIVRYPSISQLTLRRR